MSVVVTKDGDFHLYYEERHDAMSIFLEVLNSWGDEYWEYCPHYWTDENGNLQKEKYILTDPEGLEDYCAMQRSTHCVEDLFEAFPRIYERVFGATAAKAFPISLEVMREALDNGFIAFGNVGFVVTS